MLVWQRIGKKWRENLYMQACTVPDWGKVIRYLFPMAELIFFLHRPFKKKERQSATEKPSKNVPMTAL
jgi:hypothetical protein